MMTNGDRRSSEQTARASDAPALIERLGLEPHIEGGRFCLIDRFGLNLPAGFAPGRDGGRNTASAIYYMLLDGETSRWHQLKSAELWLHLAGGTLEMTLGGRGETPLAEAARRIGPLTDAASTLHTIVPAGVWQTTTLVDGDYALVACVVSPAFHHDDFRLAPGDPAADGQMTNSDRPAAAGDGGY